MKSFKIIFLSALILSGASAAAGNNETRLGHRHQDCIVTSSEGAHHTWLAVSPGDTDPMLGDLGYGAEIRYQGQETYTDGLKSIFVEVLSQGMTIVGPGTAEVGQFGWVYQLNTSCH